MNWLFLDSIATLDNIIEDSNSQAIAIFKHSTRCSISAMVKNRLERKWNSSNGIKIYYLDLLANRDISNMIAQKFAVEHQSPQALLISKGKCIFHANHQAINAEDLVMNVNI